MTPRTSSGATGADAWPPKTPVPELPPPPEAGVRAEQALRDRAETIISTTAREARTGPVECIGTSGGMRMRG